MLDFYCERLGPELLAEPLNAFSNIAFFIAAGVVWSLARRHQALHAGIWSLIAITVLIGCGSFAFHVYPVPLTRAFDDIPVLCYQLVFIWLYVRHIAGKPWWSATLVAIVYLATALYSRRFPELLNLSLAYAPALIWLAILGIYHFFTGQREKWVLLAATALFFVSVTLRSLDLALCTYIPIGLHFLWHLLNPIVIYLTARTLIVRSTPGARELKNVS